MKALLLLLFGAGALFAAEASNGVAITTNFVRYSMDEYRVSQGKLYRIHYSTNWSFYTFTIDTVATNLVLARAAGRNQLRGQTSQETPFLLLNYPPELLALTGKRGANMLTRIGTTNLNGTVLEVFDYGTPLVVQTVTTKKVASTNATARPGHKVK